ncbi:cytochrome c peroxidase [Collimonas sp. OK307]|uniref:cytochrome-c peroxidase n=1 Tax=Collimonas sp. OK307 TaxID=1801620 RepID=UPI0008E37079|nr:cytochrome c peroxidase [Collimonas sp. OK307]SFI21894.1 cytochrome c peroxidase [Collimonas sp. OK307]
MVLHDMNYLSQIILSITFGALLCVPICLAAHEDSMKLGLPPVPNPVENPLSSAKIALGQKLFFDKRLSGDGSISCASCHHPEHAFSDGLPVAKGIGGQLGTRNTPSLMNVAFNVTQFWDGRRPSLDAQALDPFVNSHEHGLNNQQALIEILRSDPEYVSAFQTAFQVSPSRIEAKHIGQAIASFERTLVAGNSPFDQYFFQGDRTALSRSAVNGLSLFRGRAGCATCHTIEKTHALFTDNEFHSLSIGLKKIELRLADIAKYLIKARDRGANLDQTVISDKDIAALGRFAVTFQPADIGKFRTPSLRNVARTAPYMHDGSIASLEEAVELELYYRSAEAGRPLILTPLEKSDLVEFLKSLNSPPQLSETLHTTKE